LRVKIKRFAPTTPALEDEAPIECGVLEQDRDTRRVCGLADLINAQLIVPKVAYSEVGKVNAYQLCLVIDSVRSDTDHSRCFTIPVPVDGAGGSAMG
jgi:hypothetical protein